MIDRAGLLYRAVLPTAFLIFAHGSRAMAGDVTLKFDFTQSHNFGGFGVQIWNPSDHPAALASLLKEQGFRIVRMSVKPKLNPEGLKDGMSPQAILDTMLSNDDLQTKQNLTSLASLLDSTGIQMHLVVWGMPTPWVTEKPYQKDGKTTTAKVANPGHSKDYANYVTATVAYARQHGLKVSSVEVTNEPDGDWNTKWTPDDFSAMVLLARRTLDSYGLQAVGIEGPGTSIEAVAQPYIQSLISNHAIASLAAISVHDWDSHNGSDPIGLTDKFNAAIDPIRRTLPVHVTEYNDEAKRWLVPNETSNGHKRYRTESAAFGVALAVESLRLIGDGASEAFLWEADDLGWEKAYLGLIDTNGNLKPAAFALRTFMSLAPIDSKAVGGVASGAGVVGTAFLTNSKVVVALTNPTDSAQTVDADFAGVGFKLRHVKSAFFYSINNPTSMQNFTASETMAKLSEHSFVIKMEPQTVIALEMVN